MLGGSTYSDVVSSPAGPHLINAILHTAALSTAAAFVLDGPASNSVMQEPEPFSVQYLLQSVSAKHWPLHEFLPKFNVGQYEVIIKS